jgi:AcrR family transcriptional regulator
LAGPEATGLPKLPVANRREEIVQAAARLFREFGFHGTSIQDIAEAVGLPKGGLYHHIESKEELLYEITTRGIRLVLPALREIRGSKDPPQAKFRRAVYTNVLHLATYRDFVSVFLQERRALSPEHYKEYIGYRDEVEQIFKDIIAEGIRQGVFRDVNVKLMTFAVLGMCSWVTQWYRPDGECRAEEIAALFAEAAECMLRV